MEFKDDDALVFTPYGKGAPQYGVNGKAESLTYGINRAKWRGFVCLPTVPPPLLPPKPFIANDCQNAQPPSVYTVSRQFFSEK